MKNEWIKVSDRLPDECIEVLVTDGVYIWLSELRNAKRKGDNWIYLSGALGTIEPVDYAPLDKFTHWQPLPEPPQD